MFKPALVISCSKLGTVAPMPGDNSLSKLSCQRQHIAKASSSCEEENHQYAFSLDSQVISVSQSGHFCFNLPAVQELPDSLSGHKNHPSLWLHMVGPFCFHLYAVQELLQSENTRSLFRENHRASLWLGMSDPSGLCTMLCS